MYAKREHCRDFYPLPRQNFLVLARYCEFLIRIRETLILKIKKEEKNVPDIERLPCFSQGGLLRLGAQSVMPLMAQQMGSIKLGTLPRSDSRVLPIDSGLWDDDHPTDHPISHAISISRMFSSRGTPSTSIRSTRYVQN